jgi:hypothetical protein
MIEGEGSIIAKPQPMIHVYSNDVETIATVLRLIGTGGIQADQRHTNISWRWTLSAWRPVADLALQIYPFLTGKRPRAEEVFGCER